MQIESSANPYYKYLKSLSRKSVRDKEGVFLAEGERFLSELPPDWETECLVFSAAYAEKGLERWAGRAPKTVVLGKGLFESLSDTQTPQGVLAVCRQRTYRLEDVLSVPDGLFLLAENLQDPGNLGTIIRTADAAGASAVLLSRGSVDLYNPKVLRSTMGSCFHIPVLQNLELYDMIEACRSRSIPVYAADLAGESPYATNLRHSAAILIGNEAAGLSEQARAWADGRLTLPMPGRAESLNAAVAASVLLYEALRQRITKE